MHKLSFFLCLLLLTGCSLTKEEPVQSVDKPRMFPNNYRQTVVGLNGTATLEHYKDYNYMEIKIDDDTFLRCAFVDNYLLVHSKYGETENKVYVKDCPNMSSNLISNVPDILENAVRTSETSFTSTVTGGEGTRLLYLNGALVTKNVGDTITDTDGSEITVTMEMGVSSACYNIEVDKNNCIVAISCDELGLHTQFEKIPYVELDQSTFSAITSVPLEDFLYLLSIYDTAMNMEE